MKIDRKVATLAGLLVGLSGIVQAGNVGKASGIVTDGAGKPVPGAKIVFKHAKQGFAREIEANEAGKYSLTTLPYGPIEVTISAAGFAPTTESFDFVPQMSPLVRDFKLGTTGAAPAQVIEGLTRELAAALDDANEAKVAGDYAKAATIYEEARKSNDHPLLLMGLVECYMKSQQQDKAEVVLQEAVKLTPAPAGAHFYLGNILAGKGKKAEAYAEFEAETKLSPENDRAFYNLGAMAVDLGKKSEATAALKRANEINPGNAEAAALLSSLLSESGDTAGAAAVASSGGSGDSTALLNIGIKLYGEHKDKEALETLQKVVATNPGSAKAHKLIGLLHVRLGDLEAAKASLRKAKEIDPKDDETNQMLAELGG